MPVVFTTSRNTTFEHCWHCSAYEGFLCLNVKFTNKHIAFREVLKPCQYVVPNIR